MHKEVSTDKGYFQKETTLELHPKRYTGVCPAEKGILDWLSSIRKRKKKRKKKSPSALSEDLQKVARVNRSKISDKGWRKRQRPNQEGFWKPYWGVQPVQKAMNQNYLTQRTFQVGEGDRRCRRSQTKRIVSGYSSRGNTEALIG